MIPSSLLFIYISTISYITNVIFADNVCQIKQCEIIEKTTKFQKTCQLRECPADPSKAHRALSGIMSSIRVEHDGLGLTRNTSLILNMRPAIADTTASNWSSLLIELRNVLRNAIECGMVRAEEVVQNSVEYTCELASKSNSHLRVVFLSLPSLSTSVYHITHNTPPTNSLTVDRSWNGADRSWNGAIAVTLVYGANKLSVVYETVRKPASAKYLVTLYQKSGMKVKSVTKLQNQNSVTFMLEKVGSYYVTVTLMNCEQCGHHNSTTSHTLTYILQVEESSTTPTTTANSKSDHAPVIRRVHSDDEEAVKLILGTIFGVLASLAIVLSIICVCRRYARQHRTNRLTTHNGSPTGELKDSPAVFLLYSYDCPEHVRVVEALSDYLVNVFNCAVYLDVFEHSTIKDIGVENWLHECLQHATFIIVLSSVGARIKCSSGKIQFKNDRSLPDYFATAVEIVSEQMKIERSKGLPLSRYIVLHTNYSKASDIPVQLELASRFKLMQDVLRLYQHMFDLNSDSPKVLDSLMQNANNYWSQLLQRSIDDAQTFFSNSDWLDSRTIKIQPLPSSKLLKRSKKNIHKLEDTLLSKKLKPNRSITINVNVNVNVHDQALSLNVQNTYEQQLDGIPDIKPRTSLEKEIDAIRLSGVTGDMRPTDLPDVMRPCTLPDVMRPSDVSDGVRPSDPSDSMRPSDPSDSMRPSDVPLKVLKASTHHVHNKASRGDTLHADVHKEWMPAESPPSLSSGGSDSTDGRLEQDIRDIRDFPSSLDHVINVHLKISNFLDRSPTYDVELYPNV